MSRTYNERDYHTRIGWWVMTHERGFAWLVECGAVVVLVCDLTYIASSWPGRSHHLAHGFEAGVGTFVITALVGALPVLPLPSARERQRFRSAMSLAGFAVIMWLLNGKLADPIAGMLGLFAGLAVFFAALPARLLLRSHPADPGLNE